jgi:hypothetical protein
MIPTLEELHSWTPEMDKAARAEGWSLFDADGLYLIQKVDEPRHNEIPLESGDRAILRAAYMANHRGGIAEKAGTVALFLDGKNVQEMGRLRALYERGGALEEKHEEEPPQSRSRPKPVPKPVPAPKPIWLTVADIKKLPANTRIVLESNGRTPCVLYVPERHEVPGDDFILLQNAFKGSSSSAYCIHHANLQEWKARVHEDDAKLMKAKQAEVERLRALWRVRRGGPPEADESEEARFQRVVLVRLTLLSERLDRLTALVRQAAENQRQSL